MAVPAHDASRPCFCADIRLANRPRRDAPMGSISSERLGGGRNAGQFRLPGLGMTRRGARKAMIASPDSEIGAGRGPKTTYRLRDWLFSRQRYWGEPIPDSASERWRRRAACRRTACRCCLRSWRTIRRRRVGEPPLARATEWLRTTDPRTGRAALRETNTMPQWAGSCWYYLRFLDPHNQPGAGRSRGGKILDARRPLRGRRRTRRAAPALQPLLAQGALRHWGRVNDRSHSQKLFNQGMILAFSYRDASAAITS